MLFNSFEFVLFFLVVYGVYLILHHRYQNYLFHHLNNEDKLRTLEEVYRILKMGGELHIADWGKPQNFLMRGAFLVVQLLDGFETTGDSVQGKLPQYMGQTGFEKVEETKQFATLFGTMCLYRGSLAKGG